MGKCVLIVAFVVGLALAIRAVSIKTPKQVDCGTPGKLVE